MMNPPLAGSISERIAQIQQTLPASVRLIAVTKQVSVEAMREAYEAGVRDFGESRVQEAELKQSQLSDLTDIVWHLIGHLQANKVQKAVQIFQWIHSVDSLKLAQRIDRIAESLNQTPNLCLQIKMMPDPTKYGWTVPELFTEMSALDALEHVNIRGIMTIPPLGLSDSKLLQLFQETQQLATKIRMANLSRINLQELSMGMSNDYPTAIQAGSTMVRLGRILFGDRDH